MKLLLENIKELVQVDDNPGMNKKGDDMSVVNTIKDAFLIIRDELIQDYGPMSRLKDVYKDDDFLVEVDCSNRLVYPAYCDAHTHLVFPHWREKEFAQYIRKGKEGLAGRRKMEIISTSNQLHGVSDDFLYETAMGRITDIIRTGTGALEIKSGYGLTLEDELRTLRIIKKIRKTTSVCIRSTFLGAHAVPLEYKSDVEKYVDLIVKEMIPQVAGEELSDFIDVSCDDGFFSTDHTELILEEGIKHGLTPKLHANEFGNSGGVQVGVKHNAISVDHLEHISKEEIECLTNSQTMPIVLPGFSFFLNTQYAPVREMIDAGLPVALASGFNPYSSPSGNMNFISSLGCINYRMIPEEVINATTINGACAMGISDRLGSITRGKTANLFITSEIPNIEYLPYAYGSNLVETVILNGEIQLL